MHFDPIWPRCVMRDEMKVNIGADCRDQISCLRKSKMFQNSESLKQNVRLTKEQCCMQCIGQPWNL